MKMCASTASPVFLGNVDDRIDILGKRPPGARRFDIHAVAGDLLDKAKNVFPGSCACRRKAYIRDIDAQILHVVEYFQLFIDGRRRNGWGLQAVTQCFVVELDLPDLPVEQSAGIFPFVIKQVPRIDKVMLVQDFHNRSSSCDSAPS